MVDALASERDGKAPNSEKENVQILDPRAVHSGLADNTRLLKIP